MAKRARETSDSAQRGDVEVEAQRSGVEVEAQQPVAVAEGDIIDAPFGAKVGSGRSRPAGTPPQPRAQTFVSAVSGGAHVNLYLSAAMVEVAKGWEHGASVRWQVKDGQYVVRLRAAAQKAYTLRHHGQQRPHFAIPTATVGGGSSSSEAVPVESWMEGDEMFIRIPPDIFADGESHS